MMQNSQIENSVLTALQQARARYFDLAKQDIIAALQQFTDLHADKQDYVFTSGEKKPVVALTGTIPVNYRGSTYNIPVAVYVLDTHPYHPPVCHVKPTPDMTIKQSQHVDANGRIYLPYLHEWKHPQSDLIGLLQIIAIVFSEQCPVFSKTAGISQSQTPAASFNPYNSNLPYPSGNFMPSAASTGPNNPSYPPYQPQSMPPYPTPNSGSFQASNAAASNYPSYPPYRPGFTNSTATGSSNPTQTSPGSTGTITDEHLRASLLSAVEDKLRRKLRDSVGQANAELQSIKNTRDDLQRGEQKLKEMLNRLQNEETNLQTSLAFFKSKNEELDRVLAHLPKDNELKIDDAIDTTAPVYRQLLNSFAEENAIEDALYHLGEGLRDRKMDLETYLKHVRRLSRQQFMLRAIMIKCRRKAGLDP